MNLLIKVTSDYSKLLELEYVWNGKLQKSCGNPFYFSRILAELMRTTVGSGWTPLVFSFWVNNRLVGVVPLKTKKIKFSNYVCSLNSDLCSTFIFEDNYRELCLNKLISYLHKRLKSQTVIITLDSGSADLKTLQKICQNKHLHVQYSEWPSRAVIHTEPSYDDWYASLKRRAHKTFRNIKNRLNKSSTWEVVNSPINQESIKKIRAVETKSWKNTWRKENKLQEDTLLSTILRTSRPETEAKPYYETEVWFLEVNGQTLAYQLVLFCKETAVFTKTSFDNDFRNLSPGKFVMNHAIRDCFNKCDIKKIDFITNLPVVHMWKPTCEGRTNIHIEQSSILFKMYSFWLKNPLIQKAVSAYRKHNSNS